MQTLTTQHCKIESRNPCSMDQDVSGTTSIDLNLR